MLPALNVTSRAQGCPHTNPLLVMRVTRRPMWGLEIAPEMLETCERRFFVKQMMPFAVS